MTSPFPRRIQILTAMNQASERGDIDEVFRLRQLHLAALTGRGDRQDAEADEAGTDDQIDWANVASEVGEMLKLNESTYKAQQAAYGTTGEPSEAEEE